MNTRPQHLRAALFAATLLATANAAAQTGPGSLAEAEAAYGRIDFESTRARAREALEGGNLSRADVARVYYLLGMTNAALNENSAARDAFTRMLALDPNQPVEQNLAPPLRTPYLEARLYWSNGRDRFDAAVTRGEAGLRVAVTDPLRMGRAALVRVRVPPAVGFTTTRVSLTADLEVPVQNLARASRVEYVVTILDEYGNRLIERGSDASPQALAPGASGVNPTSSNGGSSSRVPPPSGGGAAWQRPVGWTVLGLGAASLVGALVAWRFREESAADWNDDARCLANGMTRAQNCDSYRESAETQQTVSVVTLTAGGILAVGGAVLLLTAPSVGTSRDRALRCGPGPGTAGVACEVRF